MNDWINQEYQCINLGDKRVNEKAKKIINTLSKQPGTSIPKAFKTASEIKDCYEFFYNGKVVEEKLLFPHKKATIERIKQEPVVLMPQDTTACNYSTKPSIRDLGNIGGSNNKGIFVHPLIAITPNRVNLGIVDVKMWVREEKETQLTSHQIYALPLEEKEKFRWVESYREACKIAQECPSTQIIVITDREGDFAELYEESLKAQRQKKKYAELIVRSYHDRAIIGSEEKKLRTKLKQATPLGEVTFTIPATQNRPSRNVKQTIKSVSITFKKRSTSKNDINEEITLNAVMAIEENPPEGIEPLMWVFITTLSVSNLEEAALVIKYYLARWEIEIFFKVLKSGCEVEERRLKEIESLKSLIAIFLVIAWRIVYTMKLGRECPQMSAEILFSSSEWKAVYKVTNKGRKLPENPPSLGEFIIMIARLGGYLNRKGDPPPGPKVMWIGTNRMNDFAIAWETFGHE